jgi:hypothetical protein
MKFQELNVIVMAFENKCCIKDGNKWTSDACKFCMNYFHMEPTDANNAEIWIVGILGHKYIVLGIFNIHNV